MISPTIYTKIVRHVSEYTQSNWPEKERLNVDGIYNLDMWTEKMEDGTKYLWAVVTNTADTKDYRIVKREKVNV